MSAAAGPLFTGTGKARALTPEGLDVLEVSASQGKTLDVIGADLGLSRDAVWRVLRNQPEARSRWEIGKARKGRTATSLALVTPGTKSRPIQIQPAGIEAIRALAARGVSERTIASQLGITRKQLASALERDTSVTAAYEAGRAELEQIAVGNLIKLAVEEKSVAANIFLLKNIAGWSDTGIVGSKASATNVQIVLNAPLSREEYLKATSVTVTTGDAADG